MGIHRWWADSEPCWHALPEKVAKKRTAPTEDGAQHAGHAGHDAWPMLTSSSTFLPMGMSKKLSVATAVGLAFDCFTTLHK